MSGTNKADLTGAVNDVGFITLPNGKSLAIGVFVTNSTESMDTDERIIADIARLADDHFAISGR